MRDKTYFIFVLCLHTQCYSKGSGVSRQNVNLHVLGPERLCQTPPRNTKCARSAVFDKIRNVFSLTYSQTIAQHFRQLYVNCFHLYFMKTGHELNCCLFISRECMINKAFRCKKNTNLYMYYVQWSEEEKTLKFKTCNLS